jgi:hypothetical protein
MSAKGVVWVKLEGVTHLDNWTNRRRFVTFCGISFSVEEDYELRTDRPIPDDAKVCSVCESKAKALLLLGQDNVWWRRQSNPVGTRTSGE